MTYQPNNFSQEDNNEGKAKLTLENAIEICLENLPEDYNIELNIESGFLYLILFNDQGEKSGTIQKSTGKRRI